MNAPWVLIVAASLSAGCGILEPGDGRWRSLGLDGKWVTAVAETPWGLFAGTRNDGVFRLDPESGTWQAMGLDHLQVYTMILIPGTAPRLLVGVGVRLPGETKQAAVFATSDGATWLPGDGGLGRGRVSGRSLAVDPGRANRLYLGDSANILRSEDGGETWRYVLGEEGLAGQGVWSIVVSPARDGTAWAARVSAFGNGSIARTEDWGESWSTFLPHPGSEVPVYTLSVDQQNTRRVWAGLDAGAIVSEDGGQTWHASLVADYSTISAFAWFGDDLMAIGMYRNFDTNEAGDPVGEEINRLRLYRLPGGVGEWEEIDVPPHVEGGRSATLDSKGRLIVGTAGSGIWRWEP